LEYFATNKTTKLLSFLVCVYVTFCNSLLLLDSQLHNDDKSVKMRTMYQLQSFNEDCCDNRALKEEKYAARRAILPILQAEEDERYRFTKEVVFACVNSHIGSPRVDL